MPHTRALDEWQRLADALGELARECDASNGYILDSQANLWCAGNDFYYGAESQAVMDLTQRQLEALPKPLKKGGHIDHAFGTTYLRSFAGVYVLVLRFPGIFNASGARGMISKAVPRIEALTLALPPPDGPTSSGAAGFGVA